MKKIFSTKLFYCAFAALLLANLKIAAQEPHFTMYKYSPFFNNPGQIGAIEDIRIGIIYRNQNYNYNDNFKTSSISGFYPINIGNHRIVAAANFFNDQATTMLKTNGGSLGVAYTISTSSRSELSLGLQGGVYQKRLGGGYTTDDQYVNGNYDPNAISGDAVLNRSLAYSTLSTGLFYRIKDEQNKEWAFLSASIFNATKPNISITEGYNDNLPASIRGTAGIRVYRNSNFSVLPTVRFIHQAKNSFMNIGSLFAYELNATEKGNSKIELGIWYQTNSYGIFSLAYEQQNFTLAASFDMPMDETLNLGQNEVVEVALLLNLKKKSKIKISKAQELVEPVRTEEVEVTEDESLPEQNEEPIIEQDKVEETKVEVEDVQKINSKKLTNGEEDKIPVINKKIAAAPLTKNEIETLSKTVRFQFNTDILDEDSKLFLDKVAEIVREKTHFKIELVGYSCDIGPASFNKQISLQRAESVKKYLVEKGVNADMFTVLGVGEENPLVENNSLANREINRRVEFKVVYEK